MRYDDALFVLNQHASLEFNSDSSLKQQSSGRHVAPLWHINLIPNQPVFLFLLLNIVFLAEKQQIQIFESTTYCTRVEHAYHYTTDALNEYNIL
jgi:hypothetical protein